MAKRLYVLLAALAVASCSPLPAALADGDPASDFLLSQSTFLSPFDGHVSTAEATRLVALLAQAAKKGFKLKVAVIVTAYDLGSVPILFRRPETYARFLGEEDFYYWKDELLVVMPNGYGIYKAGGTPAPDKALVGALASPATSDGTTLVVAAEHAVSALAARRGITLQVASASGSGSSVGAERLEIAGAVAGLALLAFGTRLVWRRRSGR